MTAVTQDSDTAMSGTLFLGRQAILDRERRTRGYELLFRDGPDATSFFHHPDDATKRVIERALLHWGMERIVGDHVGYINAGPAVLRLGLHRALDPESVVIELREDEPFDGATIDALLRARRDGYRFALDNVSSLRQLDASGALPHVQAVKVEFAHAEPDQIGPIVDRIRATVAAPTLIAEKLETEADFRRAVELGFDLFQGYFFARPELLERAARPANIAAAVALLAEMQRGDLDLDRIEELVAGDTMLACRLLAVVNSSAFGFHQRVDSLRHAIVLLGVNQVRNIATLLALSMTKGADEELIMLGAVRARVASALAANPAQRGGAFTVGLLSVADALYQTSMDQLVEDLPVPRDVAAALTGGEGELGRLLAIARACEGADVDELEAMLPGGVHSARAAYGEAMQWADGLRRQMLI